MGVIGRYVTLFRAVKVGRTTARPIIAVVLISFTRKTSGLAFACSSISNSDRPAMTAATATMQYVTESTEIGHIGRDWAGDDDGQMKGVTWDPRQVTIEDARGWSSQPTLHIHGAEVQFRPIQLEDDVNQIDFLDRDDVLNRYYPHCEAIVRNRLKDVAADGGCTTPVLVRAFDHNVRMAALSPTDQLKNAGESKIQAPLQMVHGDYTAVSAPRRVQLLTQLPKANDVWRDKYPTGLLDSELVQQAVAGQRRFAFVNVWRSIDTEHPVLSLPLACVDATSVDAAGVDNPKDLRILQIHYTDRIGENYLAVYNPNHRWIYWDAMTHDEVMLIKQWDSAGDMVGGEKGIATLSLHSAFDNNNGKDVPLPPRKSIEVRIIVIY